ncbi:hypothetical protein JYT83_00450 [bacterium AH-315-F18]|nr:hypothetical protein [bacterium AH-315-F18]
MTEESADLVEEEDDGLPEVFTGRSWLRLLAGLACCITGLSSIGVSAITQFLVSILPGSFVFLTNQSLLPLYILFALVGVFYFICAFLAWTRPKPPLTFLSILAMSTVPLFVLGIIQFGLAITLLPATFFALLATALTYIENSRLQAYVAAEARSRRRQRAKKRMQ